MFLALGLAALGCSGQQDARTPAEAQQTDAPGAREPATAAERQVLGMLGSVTGESTKTVAGMNVTIGAPYNSASGRQCRQVTMAGSGTSDVKLACRDEGTWIFVPSVLASQAK